MKKQLLAAAMLAATGMMAQAATLGDGNLSISGFGTLGVAKTDTDDAKFARYNQAAGTGDSPRIGLDSNLGLQATYAFDERLSATVQVLTRKNTSQQFTTDLTWGFLKYKLNDETSVRLGRVVLPAFLISDYQNVGYANTMMRPPIEMYGQAPIENVDGGDVNWQHAFGDTNVTVQAFGGVSRGKLYIPTGAGSVAKHQSPVFGAAVTAEYGPFTARFAHARAKIEVNDLQPINALTDGLVATGVPAAIQLADELTLKGGKRMSFTEIGLTMDYKNIVLQAEYAQRRAHAPVYIPETNSGYLMAGYRFGKVLPYYTHAFYKGAGTSVSVPDLPAAHPLAPVFGAVRGLLVSPEQKSDLIGVRWDFAKSLALKVQIDHVQPKNKGGSLILPSGALTYNNSVNVYAAGIDFVF
ncbi:porin [Pseudoduganella violaceinigra]|uniref:porin n=1 Tax=Pseudoduganella violaceinigra TaxID=246602 RepID=UPI00041FCD45|nr:porin [Pseudoduganella violaceinigra]